MEIIRDTPGRIYARTNVNGKVKLLVFIACLLMVVVVGICLYGLFVLIPSVSGVQHLHTSGDFYYSLGDHKTARIDLFLNDRATTYEIPDSIILAGTEYRVTKIGARAFANKKHLEKIVLPGSLSEIGGDAANGTGAFAGCINLREIVWGGEIRNLGPYAFKNCLSLTKLDIPQSMQFIDANAFMNCRGLEELKINSANGMVSLKPSCFANCVNLTRLVLADNIGTRWDADTKQALADLTGLTKFVVGADNTNYRVDGSCLLSYDGQTLILGGVGNTIPATVTKIEDWAFGNRYTERDIHLPAQITAVGKNAFSRGVIYAAASTRPAGWETILTVRCGAESATFFKSATQSVAAYTYQENNQTLCPAYVDLFGEPDDGQTFLEWELKDDGYHATYVQKGALKQKLQELFWLTQISGEDYDQAEFANFQKNYQAAQRVYDDPKAGQEQINAALKELVIPKQNMQADVETLNATINLAKLKLENPELRAKCPLALWEDFKSAYNIAIAVNEKISQSTATIVEVRSAESNLTAQCDRVNKAAEDATGTDNPENIWVKRTQELLAAIELLDADDFEQGTWQALQDAVKEINLDAVDENTYLDLRDKYESLQVDLQSGLMALLAQCATLVADDFTAETWQVFAADYASAQKITQSNMSISQVREQLTKSLYALQTKPAVVKELADLLAQGESLHQEDYLNQDAWENLQSVLAAARLATEIEQGTQLRALRNALAALQAKPVDIGTLQIWISICEGLSSADFTASSYATLTFNLLRAQKITTSSTASQVNTILADLQKAYAGLTPVSKSVGKGNVFASVGVAQCFAVAAILFTLTIIISAVAYSLKKSQRSKIRE